MGFARKLEGILHELKPLVDQGKVAGFFLNAEGSGKLVGLAEDVHDAMMEYQVCSCTQSTCTTSEVYIRPHYSKKFMRRIVFSLWVLHLSLISVKLTIG